MAASPDHPTPGKNPPLPKTTGHEWDGITELNTPLPKWWLIVFYLTILWAIGYWILFPALPFRSHYTTGTSGWHSRSALETELASAKDFHAAKASPLATKTVEEVYNDPDLRAYALEGGGQLFKENCAPCHQAGGAGTSGYPTLADDKWLWGGTLNDIQTTILHGIRWDQDPKTRQSLMMPFADILDAQKIRQVATYVKQMSHGQATDLPPDDPGRKLYVEQCALCHSSDGSSPISKGDKTVGAPALSDPIWLNAPPGEDMPLEQIEAQIRKPRHGVMPAWSGRLNPDTDIKMLAIYVHSLGGGQ